MVICAAAFYTVIFSANLIAKALDLFTEFPVHTRISSFLEAQKVVQPTPVQEAALPLIFAGKDVQISSETGSGKTLVYLLPLVDRLLKQEAPSTGVKGLILLPTRELAVQVHKVLELLMANSGLRSVLAIGGQEFRYQSALLRKDPEIVVATPGRLAEHLDSKTVILDGIDMLVVDEADRMLDMGFRDEVLGFIEHCPKIRQTILLSATLKHRGISHIAREILNEPEIIALKTVQDAHEHIQQHMILVDDRAHKIKLLISLLKSENYDKAIVFANKRDTVDALYNALQGEIRVNRIHGEVSQDERKRVMGLFRHGGFEVLVATDVAARGLDIQGVGLVINFDMPQSGDEYVHRIGRTGRAGIKGQAISFVSSYEWNLTAGIQRYLKQSFEPRRVAGLVAKFTGPKKLKKSGKAAGSAAKKKTKPAKKKVRQREKKNVGKRRAAASKSRSVENVDGMKPPKKKT